MYLLSCLLFFWGGCTFSLKLKSRAPCSWCSKVVVWWICPYFARYQDWFIEKPTETQEYTILYVHLWCVVEGWLNVQCLKARCSVFFFFLLQPSWEVIQALHACTHSWEQRSSTCFIMAFLFGILMICQLIYTHVTGIKLLCLEESSKADFVGDGGCSSDIVYYLVLTTCSVAHARWMLTNN